MPQATLAPARRRRRRPSPSSSSLFSTVIDHRLRHLIHPSSSSNRLIFRLLRDRLPRSSRWRGGRGHAPCVRGRRGGMQGLVLLPPPPPPRSDSQRQQQRQRRLLCRDCCRRQSRVRAFDCVRPSSSSYYRDCHCLLHHRCTHCTYRRSRRVSACPVSSTVCESAACTLL